MVCWMLCCILDLSIPPSITTQSSAVHAPGMGDGWVARRWEGCGRHRRVLPRGPTPAKVCVACLVASHPHPWRPGSAFHGRQQMADGSADAPSNSVMQSAAGDRLERTPAAGGSARREWQPDSCSRQSRAPPPPTDGDGCRLTPVPGLSNRAPVHDFFPDAHGWWRAEPPAEVPAQRRGARSQPRASRPPSRRRRPPARPPALPTDPPLSTASLSTARRPPEPPPD